MDGSQERTDFAQKQVNQRTQWWRGWAFIWGPPTTTTRRHCAGAAGRRLWKLLLGTYYNMKIISRNWFWYALRIDAYV